MITDSISDINQTSGVIIRSYASGEDDLVLKVLTPEYGKLSVFAKHARKSKRRFSGGLEIFDRGKFNIKASKSLKRKSSLLILETFEPERTVNRIRSDLFRLTLASMLCEAYDLIIKEDQDSSHISAQYFEAFCLALNIIDQSEEKKDCLRACFISLRALMCFAGFLDISDMPVANMTNLKILLNRIENCVEKRLLSREDFEALASVA